MATPAKPTPLHPKTVTYRGVTVELERCPQRTRQLLQLATGGGSQTLNPLAEIEALEERTTAEAVGQLAATLIANGEHSDIQREHALEALRTHLDEHFVQRKLIRLYQR